MIVHQVIDTIRQNIELAQRQAIECDKLLMELKAKGQGKFSAIFSEGFSTRADTFLPYVEELAAEFHDLVALGKAEIAPSDIAKLVQKLEIIFSTQAKLVQTLSEESQSH